MIQAHAQHGRGHRGLARRRSAGTEQGEQAHYDGQDLTRGDEQAGDRRAQPVHFAREREQERKRQGHSESQFDVLAPATVRWQGADAARQEEHGGEQGQDQENPRHVQRLSCSRRCCAPALELLSRAARPPAA